MTEAETLLAVARRFPGLRLLPNLVAGSGSITACHRCGRSTTLVQANVSPPIAWCRGCAGQTQSGKLT